MRARRTAYVIPTLVLLLSPAMFAQMPAVPENPHELVTQNAKQITSAKQRAAAIDLLEQARRRASLHMGRDPYTMKVSFTSGGLLGTSGAQPQAEGNGTMEETWTDSARRWTAQMGGASYSRVGTGSQVYGESADEPIPMRVQMVRTTLFDAIPPRLGAAAIRSATVNYQGRDISCFLLSGAAGITGPRFWVESEYCVDPNTGLLQMWSEAPGIYIAYNYDGALEFHGHTVAREITVTEGYDTVLQIHVEGIEDARDVDPEALNPTEELGPSFSLSGPYRFPMRVDPEGSASSSVIRPVIVHATLGNQDGNVLDAEVVQSSDASLNDKALDLVWNSGFPATGMQREVFINVQFHMPAESGAVSSAGPVIWIPIGVIRATGRPRRVAVRPTPPILRLPQSN